MGANEQSFAWGEAHDEVARLRLQHKVLKSYMQDLIFAPIDLSKPGLRILDQATADGTWLRDIKATATAQHEYVGTDIADEYFPKNPPTDMSYHHQSMTEPWPADWASAFDLVHSRFALLGAGTKSLQDVVSNLANLLKPGAYLQLVEVGSSKGSIDPGPASKMLQNVFRDVLTAVSGVKSLDLTRDLEKWFELAGLVDVEQRLFEVPLGAKAGTDVEQVDSIESLVSTAVGLTTLLKNLPSMTYSTAELEALPEQLEKELKDVGGQFPVFVIWGHRP